MTVSPRCSGIIWLPQLPQKIVSASTVALQCGHRIVLFLPGQPGRNALGALRGGLYFLFNMHTYNVSFKQKYTTTSQLRGVHWLAILEFHDKE